MLCRMKEHITVADLFCGAGGLSAGLRAAGCRVVYAADCDRAYSFLRMRRIMSRRKSSSRWARMNLRRTDRRFDLAVHLQ